MTASHKLIAGAKLSIADKSDMEMFQTLHRSARTVAALTAQVLMLTVLGMWGCTHSRIVYEAGPTLAPSDLGLPERADPSTGYDILEAGRSRGRFPTALAVARLGIANNEETFHRLVVTLPEVQAIRWNSLFDTNPGIREVIVLNEKTPGPPLRGLPAVTATARRLNAGLCLVYGSTATGPEEAALIGGLIETATGQTVAHIRAQATSADYETKRPDAPAGDLRHLDLEYLVMRKFQRLLQQCVTELVTRDDPPAEQQLSPWRHLSRPADFD